MDWQNFVEDGDLYANIKLGDPMAAVSSYSRHDELRDSA
jgi:hypothetical protein